MSKLKLFTLSFAVTVCVLLTFIYVNRSKRPRSPLLKPVAQNLFITSQLSPENVLGLEGRGFQNIVDLRPDGEASDQTPSSEIKQAAEQSRMTFHYIPVPHENIPASAVEELKSALDDQTKRTVLYCRSGNRAMRTFALVEASRVDGPSYDDIIKMVKQAGFSADDLKDNINERISKRKTTAEEKP